MHTVSDTTIDKPSDVTESTAATGESDLLKLLKTEEKADTSVENTVHVARRSPSSENARGSPLALYTFRFVHHCGFSKLYLTMSLSLLLFFFLYFVLRSKRALNSMLLITIHFPTTCLTFSFDLISPHALI